MDINSRTMVGFGIREITPSVMVPMSGYDLRRACAEGVHDPLAVRAIAFGDPTFGDPAIGEAHPIVMIAFDLLGFPSYHAEPLRKRLSARFGIPRSSILCGAIHTHAAPKTIFNSFDCYDDAYVDYVLHQAEEAVAQAMAEREVRSVRYAEKTVEAVGCFRDAVAEESRFAMPTQTLWFEKENSAPIALTVYACHPTVLSEANLLMSRDLVWGCEKALSEAVPGIKTIFFNGACADISTRYTRRESTFAEAERLGAAWAEAIAAGRAEAKPVGDADRTAVLAENVYIPPAEFFTGEKRASVLAYLKNKIDACEDERRRREYISCALVLERKNYGLGADGKPRGGENVYVAAARFGDVQFVFLPFEYAQKDAALLKEDAEKDFGGHCIVVCYSNGYDGYLPSGRPLDQDSGYEDMASGYRSDAKELTKETLMGLLTKLI